MKKNPFLIDKKIIITDNQTTSLKGGRELNKSIGCTVGCTLVVCGTLVGPHCDKQDNE